MSTFGISLGFPRLSQSSGQVTHVLLTRSRLCPGPKPGSSLHLHVLSTPPAFVLSQDQTLREERGTRGVPRFEESVRIFLALRTHGGANADGKNVSVWQSPKRPIDGFRTWTSPDSVGRTTHAVEFSKTAAPLR